VVNLPTRCYSLPPRIATSLGSGFAPGVTRPLLTGPVALLCPQALRSCSYGLMCQSAGLPPTVLVARGGVLAAWTTPCWSHGPSRRYLCASFPACLDPYPGSSRGARTRFFPQDFGLPPVRTGSALSSVRTATSVRGLISGLQSVLYVQARRFAHHPGRSYRNGLRRWAAVVFTSEPLVVCYLPTPRIC
jgi:hypothetical protein